MTEQDTSESLMRVRRRGLESSWSRTLTPLFFGLNRANLVSCGLAAAPLPRMSFTRDADVDPAQEVEAVTALLDAGVMLDAAETYERLGRKMPETAPEVLEGKPDPMAIGPDGEPIAPDVPGGPRAMPKDDAEVAAASDAVLARFDAMSGRLDSMAARDPVVNIHVPPITIPDIHIPAPQITVNAPPAPDVNVTVEAAKPVDVTVNVAPTPVTVENTVNVPKGAAPVVKMDAPIIPPALVTVEAPKFRRKHTKINRDSSGEMVSTETTES
jgi:hypothetical protein